MNNEYNERLFWKVFKNLYLLNNILKNKCCHKSKKFKTITSIGSMLKHKQYQLLIYKLKVNENLYLKSAYENDKIMNQIKDIEVFKEIYSLLLFKGYRDVKNLFDTIWGIKSVDLFDIHLKYHPEELQTYIPSMIKSIFRLNHPKLLMRVLDYYEQYLNDNKPFTLTKIERNYFIMDCISCNGFEDLDNHEEIKEKIKIILNIPISTTSIFRDLCDLEIFSRTDTNVNVRWYLKFQKLLSLGFNNIRTSFYYPAENLGHNIKIPHKPLLPKFEKIRESVRHKDMVSSFCYGFDKCIKEHIEDVKGELEYISTSINSVLLYFKLYYCNYYYGGKSKSIPTSIQTQIDIIIQNNKHRRCTLYQSIKQLFQLLINETESIVLYACYLKEYNEPIDNIEPDEEMIIVLLYFMTKTYNTNILKFLLKKHIKINLKKSELASISRSFLNILFKDNQINKNNINKFNKIYISQKSIIIENIDERLLNNIKSKKEQEDIALGDKQLNSILCSKSSSKWKEITSNLIDNDKIVTIKDKETIDWLSDIETGGGCSILNIRNALHSKLKQMKLDFSTSELLEYARIKFKQVIPILDSNKELCNIHILRTHDDIVSLINRLNQSNFNDNENLFKYYMIQLIQFGSRNSIKYLRLICDSTDEFYSGYDGLGGLVVSIFDYKVIKFFTNSYSYNADVSEDSLGYYQNEEFNKYKIPTQQTCQIINLTKIKVKVNLFQYETSNLFQTFIKLLNFEGVQFILDNLNGKHLELNTEPFQDGFHDRIYTCKYLYKDLIEMIQFLIDKFKDGQLSLSNLSLILNYLFLKLIRVNNLTIDQIKTAHQLISNYIKIDSSKHTSYYYLKTLSPIIESCITIIKDPANGFKKGTPFCGYNIDASVYTFKNIFKNRNNNDLNQFIDSTIIDIVKDGFNMEIFSKMLYNNNNNPRINLFLHYFEMELEKRKTNEIKKPFLDYKLLKLIIKTFDLESFIKLDNLLQKYEIYLRRDIHNVVNGEQEDANDDGEHVNSITKQLDEYGKPLSTNMVEWFGTIIYKDYSDYQDIINHLFNKYKHQLEPYIYYYKLKLLNQNLVKTIS